MPALQLIIDAPAVNTFSGASQQTLHAEPIPPNISGWVRTMVALRRVSDGACKSIVIDGSFKRATGNLSVHSVLAVPYGSNADLNALSDCIATMDAVGTDLLIRVEGQAGQDIDWSAVLRGMGTQHEAV